MTTHAESRSAETSALKLRAHQRPAVAATVRTLTHYARAQLIAACGCGKTVMGSAVARQIGGRRTLVLVPTLDLLWQTARTYQRQVLPGTVMVAVGSGSELNARSPAQAGSPLVEVTTSAAELRALARAEPVVVLSTYASLPVVEQAQVGGLAAFDVAVVDEAHRTAGAAGRPWAAVHDASRLRAGRRLYLTATPRIY